MLTLITVILINIKWSKVAILALGDFYQLGEEVLREIEKELGFTPTLINPRYITGLDKEMLTELQNNHDMVITLEDGILNGGFGEKIASFYGTTDMKVKNYGFKKEFIDRYEVNEIMEENGITKEQIIKDILSCNL